MCLFVAVLINLHENMLIFVYEVIGLLNDLPSLIGKGFRVDLYVGGAYEVGDCKFDEAIDRINAESYKEAFEFICKIAVQVDDFVSIVNLQVVAVLVHSLHAVLPAF